MSIEIWIAFVLALILLGLSPGPAWASVVATSLARGFRPAAAMAVGVALADVFFVLLAVFGLVLLAKALGAFFLIVKFAGAVYLIWLGVKLWRCPPAAPPTAGGPPRPDGSLGPFLAGFALTLGNPKAIAFYLGFLPAFIDLTAVDGWDIGAIAATAFAVIAAMLSGYAGLAARSRRLFRHEAVRRRMGRVLGSALIGTGVVVATR